MVAGSAGEAGLVAEVARPGTGPDSGRVVALAGRLDVVGLAGLIAGAEAAVVNNSGGMHLADAVRTPVVVLFAGTELIAEYRPRSTRAVVLNRPTACTPCRAFRCPYAHQCLDVTPGEVVDAVLAVRRRGVA